MTRTGDVSMVALSKKEQEKLQAIYRSPFYKRLIAARCGVAQELNLRPEDARIDPLGR